MDDGKDGVMLGFGDFFKAVPCADGKDIAVIDLFVISHFIPLTTHTIDMLHQRTNNPHYSHQMSLCLYTL